MQAHLGKRPAGIAPDKELIPLFVTDGIEVDVIQLDERVHRLANRYGRDYVVGASQLRVSEEPEFAALRARVCNRLEHIGSDPYYTPDLWSRSGYARWNREGNLPRPH